MAITAFDHVGIQVQDVERSTRFYEELGLKCVARWSRSEPYIQRLVGYYPDVTLEIALLEIPTTTSVLEIIEYRNVPRAPVDPDPANPGTGHLCFMVDDLEDLYARLGAKGVVFQSEVQTSTAGIWKGGRVVYLLDPDGIRVELAQLPVTTAPTPLP
jgi:lactoylglutathione lyase